MSRRRLVIFVAGASAGMLLSACSAGAPAADVASASARGADVSSTRATPGRENSDEIAGVRVSSTVGGFSRPWDLRFLPDGTPLVTERPGRISAIVNGTRKEVARVPGVVSRGEGGLMGLAIDPQFDKNRRIYTCFAAGSGESVAEVRVVRYRLAEDLSGIGDAKSLVTDIPAGAGNRHLGCRLEIGPDGMLWITTGDAAEPEAPQDPKVRAGKVLRATLSGEPAPGNPAGSWDPYVYSLGHRNPQGLSFRPTDGAAFGVEHGTDCDDEINQLVPGGNFGWDPVDESGEYQNFAPMTSPDIDDAIGAVWSSGCPTIAPSGSEFISGQQWLGWRGRLAIAVLKDEKLLVLELEGGQVTNSMTVLEGKLGRLRTVRNAPDGSLWLTVDSSPGAVVRLSPMS